MQMFRKAIDSAVQGDRLGLCVTQFDPKLLERGVVCTSGALPMAYGLIVNVDKIPYFKQAIRDKTKFHITSGHETIMAKANLFACNAPQLDYDLEYRHVDEVDLPKYWLIVIFLLSSRAVTQRIDLIMSIIFIEMKRKKNIILLFWNLTNLFQSYRVVWS